MAGAVAAALFFARRRRREARFLSFVSHELNTPLTALYMTAMNLIQGVFGPPSEGHGPWLDLLREQAVRLTAVLGDLRDYIHMEFHKDLRLEIAPCDAAFLLREVLETMEETWSRSGVALDVSGLPKALPVRADRDRLRRVISSALWHTRKFHGEGPVMIGGAAAPPSVGIEFKTSALTGKDARDMLEPYYPVDRPKSAVLPGVGLGLGFSRLLMDRMGGRLEFGVEAGGKARIGILLPGGAADGP